MKHKSMEEHMEQKLEVLHRLLEKIPLPRRTGMSTWIQDCMMRLLMCTPAELEDILESCHTWKEVWSVCNQRFV